MKYKSLKKLIIGDVILVKEVEEVVNIIEYKPVIITTKKIIPREYHCNYDEAKVKSIMPSGPYETEVLVEDK